MAPPTLALRDGAQPSAVYREPLGGTIISIMLSLSSITILSIFLSGFPISAQDCFPYTTAPCSHSTAAQRFLAIKVWRRLPYVVWRKRHPRGIVREREAADAAVLLTSDSGVCHLCRLVPFCLCHCHITVRLRRRLGPLRLRGGHPALSRLLCYDQGKVGAELTSLLFYSPSLSVLAIYLGYHPGGKFSPLKQGQYRGV